LDSSLCEQLEPENALIGLFDDNADLSYELGS